jgi:tetratricopeptide (TPR) repeat protein
VTLVAELSQALHDLEQQPHGAARVAAAERLVERAAETGDKPLLIQALQEQISAYNFGGESQRMLVPFARVLRMWDDRPQDFGEYARYRLFWHFKWASTGMIWHPDVPLATIRHWLTEMERRYRIAGHGLQPVFAQHHNLAVHLGDTEAAARYFDEWTAADRTEMSDCHACELNAEGDWHQSNGDAAGAVRIWAPVLHGEETCLEEPHVVLAKSLLPLVRLGRVDEARANHLRGYRMVRGNPNLLRAIGMHIEFAALTGNEARGLEMLAEHANRLELGTAEGAANRIGLHEAAAVLLRRLCDIGQGSLEVAVPPGRTTTVAALLPAVEREVEATGRRFDERNGTPAVSDRSRQRLAAKPLLASLPLGVRATTVVPAPPPSTVDSAAPVDLDTLIADANRLTEARDRRAAQAWERVAAAGDQAKEQSGEPLTPAVEARIAESRAVAAARSDPAAALELFLAVADRFDAAGEPARAVVNRARAGLAAAMAGRDVPASADPLAAPGRLAALRAEGGAVDDRLMWAARFCAVRTDLVRWMATRNDDGATAPDPARVALERDLAALIADAERDGAAYELADALVNRAQVALVTGDPATATGPLDRAIETFLATGAPVQAADALVIRARVALGDDDPVAAQTHLLRARQVGGDLLDAPTRAEIASALADTHMSRGGGSGAAAAEALTAAHLLDAIDPDAALRMRRRAAFAFERDGRPAEAAALLESVLPDVERDGDEADLASARQQYGRCLFTLAEYRDAARMFISAARLARDWPDQMPHASLTHEAGSALESAGQSEDAEAAYLRAADLWHTVGDPEAATRATRAAAWTLVQRADPDFAGALDLFTRAATMSVPERPETQYQTAQLLLDWPADDRPDGYGRRLLALADEAAAGFRDDGDLDRATRADLLAADTLGTVLDDPAAARSRIARAREHAVTAGATDLIAWCDGAVERWAAPN